MKTQSTHNLRLLVKKEEIYIGIYVYLYKYLILYIYIYISFLHRVHWRKWTLDIKYIHIQIFIYLHIYIISV